MVRWFVDGAMVYSQSGDDVIPLIHPMRVMMNLWIAPYPDWVGEFDPTVLPVQADYDRVAVYRYSPGSGDAGTSGDFSLLWEDSFQGPLDADRWIASAKDFFEYTTFLPEHVTASGSVMSIYLGEQRPREFVNVTFRYVQMPDHYDYL